ncbi:MAG: AAA family ATPase [Spirochaetota bacterium]|nr:AAA family ATPase [Spirochaetota bacterium]
MKKLPIGIQTFKDIIDGNYYYVDKTPFIVKLMEGSKYYFLSRPRRFGKSLFLDTIESAFKCQKELFNGLSLYDKWDWESKYPVVKISFGSGVCRNITELRKNMSYNLDQIVNEYSIKSDYTDLVDRLSQIIEILFKKYKKQVVILVDEYDKPILDSITNQELATELRDELKNYYSVIKDSDRYIKLCFITGVSKFSKVNLFSGLNNLNDITIRADYGDICGYTQSELETVFKDRICDFDSNMVKSWYNGYSFTGESVYNPFDILLLFDNKEFKNYWFETGTPSFLIKLLQKNSYFIPEIEYKTASDRLIGNFEIDDINVETLLFQTGYLTIKNKEQRGNRIVYTLDYPNIEVKMSLTDSILAYLSKNNVEREQDNLYDSLLDGELNRLESVFHSFFASIPNDWYRKNSIGNYEGYYASIFYCYFTALGLDVIAEDVTNHGRIDLTVKIEDKIYIIEFKVVELITDGNPAIEQIKSRKYYEKYVDSSKDIYLLGVEFSKTDRNITRYQWEKM